MSRTCPDHPQAMSNGVGDCLACAREAAATDHSAGIAAVRAAFATAPPPPRTDRPDQPARPRRNQ